MDIKFDALGYERLATIIFKHGWVEFFKDKPEKVAFYPALIALSMRIADLFSIQYQIIQKLFQVGFLLSGQVLVFTLLGWLNINKNLKNLITLYYGLSPAIVNSAFSLYCEVTTYAFVIGIVMLSAIAWNAIRSEQTARAMLLSACVAALFVVITLTRAVYEYIFILFALFVIMLALPFLFKKRPRVFLIALFFVAGSTVLYHSALYPYKMMNQKNNGYKSLTLVGYESLYSTSIGRVRNLTTANFLSFLANVPGENVCRSFLGEKECYFWSDDFDYALGQAKTQELRIQGLTNDQVDSELKSLTVDEILRKPFQYALLTGLEGCKLLFWESTKIGFVNYPRWLQNVFDFTPFKNGLRLFMFLATAAGTFFCLHFCWKKRQNLYAPSSDTNTVTILIFILFIIFANILLHAPFKMATRYALPFAPLYLVCIAVMIQRIFHEKINSRKNTCRK